jgi:hypothetical protein
VSNQPTSFRFPFKLPPDTHEQVAAAIRYTFSGVKDLNDAVKKLNTKVNANTGAVSTVTQVVNTVTSGGGGGGTSPLFGFVNLQPNLTPGAYTLAQTDLGGLILVQSAIAFALTLNSGLTLPFFVTVFNLGSATITATPSAGNVNNAASITVVPNQLAIFYFDGSNWWDVFPFLAKTIAPAAGQFLTGYDATTGLFTQGAAATSSFGDGEVPPEVPDGIRTTFTLLHSPNPVLSVQGFDNGVLQYPTLAFTVAANIVTFLVPPIAGHSLIFWYRY